MGVSAATSAIRSMDDSAAILIPRRHAVEQPQALGAEPDLGGRFLAGRVEDPIRTDRARDSAGGLEEERRLADPGLPADEDDRARDEPATEDAIQLGIPIASRSCSDRPTSPSRCVAVGPPNPGPVATRDGRGSARTAVSTRLFHAWQARHWPSHRRKDSPQDWQT